MAVVKSVTGGAGTVQGWLTEPCGRAASSTARMIGPATDAPSEDSAWYGTTTATATWGYAPVIHCTVQNITSGGACLKVGNTYGVPETFDLTFESGRTRRACHVMWRTTDRLGVAFERTADAPVDAGSPALAAS